MSVDFYSGLMSHHWTRFKNYPKMIPHMSKSIYWVHSNDHFIFHVSWFVQLPHLWFGLKNYPKLTPHMLKSIYWVQNYGLFILHVSWFVKGLWLISNNHYQRTHRPGSQDAIASKNYQENLSSSSPYMVLVLLKNLNVRYKKSKKLLIQYKCNNWSLSPNMTFCVCSCSISHVGLTT